MTSIQFGAITPFKGPRGKELALGYATKLLQAGLPVSLDHKQTTVYSSSDVQGTVDSVDEWENYEQVESTLLENTFSDLADKMIGVSRLYAEDLRKGRIATQNSRDWTRLFFIRPIENIGDLISGIYMNSAYDEREKKWEINKFKPELIKQLKRFSLS